MDGILVIDKPAGPTSHDIVQQVKHLIGARKVGHLGTLDPAATGVLPLVINGATKYATDLAGDEKVYEFTLELGVTTDTDDDAGRVIARSDVPGDVIARIKAVIPRFVGEIMQRPPAYSAIKLKGQRAYKMARKGVQIDIKPRPVRIDSLAILGHKRHGVRMRLECRSGTYVRSLSRDLGEAIGCAAHASHIRRLRSGRYSIDQALSLAELLHRPELWKERLLPIFKKSLYIMDLVC